MPKLHLQLQPLPITPIWNGEGSHETIPLTISASRVCHLAPLFHNYGLSTAQQGKCYHFANRLVKGGADTYVLALLTYFFGKSRSILFKSVVVAIYMVIFVGMSPMHCDRSTN
jgi:hypothetical protein